MTKWHLAILVSLLSMIGPFSIDTYLPSFESMENDLGVSRALMTQTLGAYLMAFGASTLIWGAVTDWIGRKPVILISLGSYLLASVACALASSYEQLLLFRILQGFGIGGGLISGRAMVRDVLETKDAQKVIAHAMMLFAASPAIAPIFGGWLHDAFGWRSVFWFLAIYGALVFIYSAVVIRESLHRERRNSIHIREVSRVYLRTLKNAHYLRLVIIFATAFASFFIFVAGSPTLLFDILKLEAGSFYVLFVPIVTGIMLGAFASNRLIHRYRARQITHVSLLLMFLLAAINLLLSYSIQISILRVIGPVVLYSFCLSLIMPVLTIAILDCFPNNRGAATAMQSFIQMGFNGFTASFIVALLGSVFIHFNYAQIILISIAVAIWIYDCKKMVPERFS
jgi:DHA1 family bicyclomycin/chloramphenicol resistance-like MFS transporter